MTQRFTPIFYSIIAVLLSGAILVHTTCKPNHLILKTPYGTVRITDPCLREIIESPSIQRLKKVHQYGIIHFTIPTEPYSHYDHVIGNLALLYRFGASKEELIGGLLQNASQTACSHLANQVFSEESQSCPYNEKIQIWFFDHSEISTILQKYNYDLFSLLPKRGKTSLLMQPLPNLCADRIEYILQGALRHGTLTQTQLDSILSDLHLTRPHWYFTNPKSARLLADTALYLTLHLWGTPADLLANQWTSQAVLRALETGILHKEDFLLGEDQQIWKLLVSSKDPFIQKKILSLKNINKNFRIAKNNETAELTLQAKFRGIDPLILANGELVQLSQIDSEYAQKFTNTKEKIDSGWQIILSQK